jgi:spore maturation protein CgeB
MRVLVVHPGPHFSVADVHNGIVKGLRQNGCEVVDLNFDRYLDFYCGAHLENVDTGEWVQAFDHETAVRNAARASIDSACYQFWPDVVIVVSGFFVPPEQVALIRSRGHHTVFWATEEPYEHERHRWMAEAFDTVVVNDPCNLDSLRQLNGRTFYVPHGYDPDLHHPGPNRNRFVDFGWVGTAYPSRVRFLERVDLDNMIVELAGNWEAVGDDSPLKPYVTSAYCINNAEAADLYRRSKISANIYRKEADLGHNDGWAMGPREVELAACGTFFLREPRGEGDELFPMLPTFQTPAEFSDALRWWLRHDRERDSAAAKAREAVADRTFQALTADVLRRIPTSN